MEAGGSQAGWTVVPKLLCGPQTGVSTQKWERTWDSFRDHTELKLRIGLEGPELRDLFLEASSATLRSGLVSVLKGLEGARGRLGDSRGEAGCGDGSCPHPHLSLI